MATPLPRIGEETVAAIEATNVRLDTLITTVNDMSTRLNIKLGSMATMMSDFFDFQRTTDTSTNGLMMTGLLVGIETKIGELTSKFTEFFEDVRRRWATEDLTRPPPGSGPNPPRPSPGGGGGGGGLPDPEAARGWASKWIAAIFTGLGLAIIASSTDIVSEAVKQSGITAFLTLWLGKILYSVSGIGRLFSSIAANPLIASIIKLGSTVIGWVNMAGKLLVPFYELFITVGKRLGRLIPFVAAVTTALDFLRGFEQGKDMLEGIKFGIAEVAAGWIGWPLEILKDIVSWAAGKLGFENFASMLDGFDIVGLVKNLAMSIFDVIAKTFDFSDASWDWGYWTAKVADICALPVNAVINFLKTLFSGTPETDFDYRVFMLGVLTSVTDWVNSFFTKENFASMYESVKQSVIDTFSYVVDTTLNAIKDILSKITDYLPSIEDIKQKLASFLPEWWTGKPLESQLADIEKNISDQSSAIGRSQAGEKVFEGWLTGEESGRAKATVQLQEAKQLREDIVKAIAKRDGRGGGGPTNNISIVNGGNRTYATNNSTTNLSATPPSGRPD
jgi:hypothetical protein